MRLASTKPRWLIAVAAVVVATFVGLLVPIRKAGSMQLVVPPGGVIQGNTICGSAPNIRDFIQFNGVNWCGTQFVIANATIIGRAGIGAGNPVTAFGTLPVGALASAMTTTTGELSFGDPSVAALDYNITNSGAFTFNQPVAIGTSAPMTAAPEMFMLLADYGGSVIPAIGRLYPKYVATTGMFIDNCNVTWKGWSGCTTFPTFSVDNNGSSVCSTAVTATPTQASATPTAQAVTAGNALQLRVTVAGVGCTQPVGGASAEFTIAYHAD